MVSNTPLSSTLPFLPQEGVIFLFWVLILSFMFLYLIFTLILMRQIFLMTDLIQTSGSWFLKLISVLYIFFVLGIIGIVIFNFL